jgi:eukaryotic-like serine/threonine-protein kinase
MTPREFERVRNLFDRAMALPPAERSQFVEAHAPHAVRSELLAMVLAGDDSKFLANAVETGLFDQVRPAGDTPSQIGPYKILRELGRGGMGVVYMALRNDDVFNKVVALKVIGDSALAAGIALVERFKQERQILAGLDHPNIARILDGGNTPDGRPFYVMEYVAGSPIDDYCARMNVDVPTRVRMMAQACDAIEYLHKNAIAHRDVKPHNILVTLDGRVKLVDFGIAKVESVAAVVGSSAMAGQPTMIMTPGYASPEQLTGESSGKISDIYSLAVVLYQLLTGRLPYADREGRPNLKAQLSGETPDPPSKRYSKTPTPTPHAHEPRTFSHPDLDRVVLTALQRDPLQRYPTVEGFADDLRRCLDGRPIAAHPSTLTYRFGKLVGRNRVAAVLAVVTVLAIGAGAGLAISTQMERVRLQAKEEELERFISLLSVKVTTRWQQTEELVPATEKVADVQAANRIMASDTVRELSERAPDPARVKQLITSLRGVLEKADDLSRGQAPLRKEIAKVFRQIGDFESSAPLAPLTDKQQAVRAYQRAAVIAADIQSVDAVWATQQISELSSLVQGLGSTLDVPSATTQADATSGAAPEPVPVSRRASAETATAEPTAVKAVDAAAREEIRQRLRATTLDAERARRSFEMLRDSLSSRGQTIRSDVEVSLTAAEGLLEDAKSLLDANELEMAEDYVRRAGFQLRKVFQAVGG